MSRILAGALMHPMEPTLNLQEFMKADPVTGPTQKPVTLSAVGLRQAVLEDLALKTLYLSGPFSVLELSKLTRLSFEVASELFNRLRTQQLCQVTGMSGQIPNLAITSQGRTRAQELLAQSQYIGPAPVPLSSYVALVKKQSVANVEVHPADVERAFSRLVLDDETLWQLGTALNSGEAIFLYGPSGVGKTTIAETLSRVLAEDAVWLPYAVEIDGQVITVYDPTVHKRLEDQEPHGHDERWVLCQRPSVLVGGELTIEMLDLQYNPATRFYSGPIQMKSNNGVLIIDDFGRQRVRPDDLLNRWVVPLDRRIDFLTLAGGRKIEIPFEMLVVFASNLDPTQLLDAAFLRRIQTKIRIGEATEREFCEIFRRVAVERGMHFENSVATVLVDYIKETLKQELRSCYPRDIVNQICWAAKYENKDPLLNHRTVMRAIESYFLVKS
jgi:predicted ATPase with chaperone activity